MVCLAYKQMQGSGTYHICTCTQALNCRALFKPQASPGDAGERHQSHLASASLPPTQLCLGRTVSEGAVRAVVGCLGWDGVALASARRQVGQQADRVTEEGRRPLYPLTVRLATALHARPLRAAAAGGFWQQIGVWRLFAVDALFGVGAILSDVQSAQVTKACRRLGDAMRNLWQLPWENERKELLWRLAVHGFPGAGGHDIRQAGPCPCGWAGPRQGSPAPPASL